MPPEVADAPLTGQADPGELIVSYGFRLRRSVEEAQSLRAVLQVFSEDVDGSHGPYMKSRLAQRVLINGENLVVGKQPECERVKAIHVAADQKGGGEETPEAQVRVLLIGAQLAQVQGRSPADVTDDKHIGIVPVARAGEGRPPVLDEADLGNPVLPIA